MVVSNDGTHLLITDLSARYRNEILWHNMCTCELEFIQQLQSAWSRPYTLIAL